MRLGEEHTVKQGLAVTLAYVAVAVVLLPVALALMRWLWRTITN